MASGRKAAPPQHNEFSFNIGDNKTACFSSKFDSGNCGFVKMNSTKEFSIEPYPDFDMMKQTEGWSKSWFNFSVLGLTTKTTFHIYRLKMLYNLWASNSADSYRPIFRIGKHGSPQRLQTPVKLSYDERENTLKLTFQFDFSQLEAMRLPQNTTADCKVNEMEMNTSETEKEKMNSNELQDQSQEITNEQVQSQEIVNEQVETDEKLKLFGEKDNKNKSKQVEEGEEEDTIDAQRVYFSFSYEYSYERVQEFLEKLTNNLKNDEDIYFHNETLTYSSQFRFINLLTISSHDQKTNTSEPYLNEVLFPDRYKQPRAEKFKQSKPVILISARVHPGETPASFAMEGLIKFLVDKTDLRALLLRKYFTFWIVPMLNPDGVYNGHYRMDVFNQNLNRYYQIANSIKQPSIYAMKRLISQLSLENRLFFYMDFHAHAGKKGTFLYGNAIDEFSQQVENQVFAKFMAANDPTFEPTFCNFSKAQMRAKDKQDELTKEGCGRVFAYQQAKIVHSYTLECGFHHPSVLGQQQPCQNSEFSTTINGHVYGLNEKNQPQESTIIEQLSDQPCYLTPAHFENTGKAVLLSILDAYEKNPFSRIPVGTIETIRRETAIELARSDRIRMEDAQSYSKAKNITQLLKDNFFAKIEQMRLFQLKEHIKWPVSVHFAMTKKHTGWNLPQVNVNSVKKNKKVSQLRKIHSNPQQDCQINKDNHNNTIRIQQQPKLEQEITQGKVEEDEKKMRNMLVLVQIDKTEKEYEMEENYVDYFNNEIEQQDYYVEYEQLSRKNSQINNDEQKRLEQRYFSLQNHTRIDHQSITHTSMNKFIFQIQQRASKMGQRRSLTSSLENENVLGSDQKNKTTKSIKEIIQNRNAKKNEKQNNQDKQQCIFPGVHTCKTQTSQVVIIKSTSPRTIDSARLNGNSDEIENLGLIMPYSKEENEDEDEIIGFPNFEVGYSPVISQTKNNRNILSPNIQAEANRLNSQIPLKDIISKQKVQDEEFDQPNQPFQDRFIFKNKGVLDQKFNKQSMILGEEPSLSNLAATTTNTSTINYVNQITSHKKQSTSSFSRKIDRFRNVLLSKRQKEVRSLAPFDRVNLKGETNSLIECSLLPLLERNQGRNIDKQFEPSPRCQQKISQILQIERNPNQYPFKSIPKGQDYKVAEKVILLKEIAQNKKENEKKLELNNGFSDKKQANQQIFKQKSNPERVGVEEITKNQLQKSIIDAISQKFQQKSVFESSPHKTRQKSIPNLSPEKQQINKKDIKNPQLSASSQKLRKVSILQKGQSPGDNNLQLRKQMDEYRKYFVDYQNSWGIQSMEKEELNALKQEIGQKSSQKKKSITEESQRIKTSSSERIHVTNNNNNPCMVSVEDLNVQQVTELSRRISFRSNNLQTNNTVNVNANQKLQQKYQLQQSPEQQLIEEKMTFKTVPDGEESDTNMVSSSLLHHQIFRSRTKSPLRALNPSKKLLYRVGLNATSDEKDKSYKQCYITKINTHNVNSETTAETNLQQQQNKIRSISPSPQGTTPFQKPQQKLNAVSSNIITPFKLPQLILS